MADVIDPLDMISHSVHLAVADFVIQVQQAETRNEVLRVYERIAEVMASLDAVESISLEKAERMR